MLIKILGYVGMAIVASSFLCKDIKWVRIVNICGAVLSAIYGLLTATYPTMILNIILIIVNVIMLIKIKGAK